MDLLFSVAKKRVHGVSCLHWRNKHLSNNNSTFAKINICQIFRFLRFEKSCAGEHCKSVVSSVDTWHKLNAHMTFIQRHMIGTSRMLCKRHVNVEFRFCIQYISFQKQKFCFYTAVVYFTFTVTKSTMETVQQSVKSVQR